MFKKVVIAGGSGQLGSALVRHLKNTCDEIVILSRSAKHAQKGLRTVVWDGETPSSLWEELEEADVVINLSGKNVNCRHTAANRKEILTSRLKPIETLAKAIALCNRPPKVWIQASAGAIYGSRQYAVQTENSAVSTDGFMPSVCQQWEDTFAHHTQEFRFMRTAVLRLGVVLGETQGAYPRLRTLVKLGLGGKAGNGQQYLSWIHEDDAARAIVHIASQSSIEGAVNLAAPEALSNSDFMKTLRKVQGVPFGLPAPAPALKIGAALLGTEASIVLDSMRIKPEKLLQSNFSFLYPTLELALQKLR